MLTKFDNIITSFLNNNVGLTNDFLSESLASHLKENLLHLHSEKKLLLAGTGNGNQLNHDASIRSDKIYWLDRKHNDEYENSFFDVIDAFVSYLNSTCYVGITDYEFHYAIYEAGTFYKKHLDQFKNNTSRAYSMIMYLNVNWIEKDGGQLKIYHPSRVQTIAPENRKCVFFKSNALEHEVLLSHAPRLSITGWLKTAE